MIDIPIKPPLTLTSRSNLIAAFRRVVASTGRRQATDLHVRRLLNYVRAKDVDGQGVKRSLKQLADRLILSESTCRRVIRRAVKHIGLLIVIPQRHVPGGQTANRYAINWHHVDFLLSSNVLKSRARSKRISSPESRATLISRPAPGNTNMPVRLAPANEVRDTPGAARTDLASVPKAADRIDHPLYLSENATASPDMPIARSSRILPTPYANAIDQFARAARTPSCYELAPDADSTPLRSSSSSAVKSSKPDSSSSITHYSSLAASPVLPSNPASVSLGKAPVSIHQSPIHSNNTFTRAARTDSHRMPATIKRLTVTTTPVFQVPSRLPPKIGRLYKSDHVSACTSPLTPVMHGCPHRSPA